MILPFLEWKRPFQGQFWLTNQQHPLKTLWLGPDLFAPLWYEGQRVGKGKKEVWKEEEGTYWSLHRVFVPSFLEQPQLQKLQHITITNSLILIRSEFQNLAARKYCHQTPRTKFSYKTSQREFQGLPWSTYQSQGKKLYVLFIEQKGNYSLPITNLQTHWQCRYWLQVGCSLLTCRVSALCRLLLLL